MAVLWSALPKTRRPDFLPMNDPKKDDETKFNETLKRMLSTPPKPHQPKPLGARHKKEKPAK